MSEHELWNELGNLYFLTGSFGRAARAYNNAIALDQKIGEPYNNIALTYAQMGKHKEAADFYRRGIEFLTDAHEKAMALQKLGDIHLHLKEYPQAMEAYQQADALLSVTQPNIDANEQIDALLHCKPHLVETVDELASPAFDTGMELLPLVEELTPWWFDGQSTPDDDPPAQDAWLEDEIIFPDYDESVVFTDPLTWERASTYQGSIITADASNQALSRENYMLESVDSNALEALEVTMNMLAVREPSSQITSSKKKKRNGSHTEPLAAKAEVEVAEVSVITNEPQTVTDTPEFSAQDITSIDAVLYETPADLPVLELSPDERAVIEAEIDKIYQSLNKNQNDASAWNVLGAQYKNLGQYDDAIGAYQEAVSLEPSNAVYHHDLGLVYAAMGKFDNAIAAFENVIEIDPSHSLAHATLGGYYLRNGKEELAQAHIEKARRLIANDENEYNQACMESISGNTDRSFELLEIALKNKPIKVNWARDDPDFEFIRTDPRFHALLTKYATRTGK